MMKAGSGHIESLEQYAAMQEDMDDDAGLGLDQEGQSALDMLGEAENVANDIDAKLE